jgi:hypothetical protein
MVDTIYHLLNDAVDLYVQTVDYCKILTSQISAPSKKFYGQKHNIIFLFFFLLNNFTIQQKLKFLVFPCDC